MKNLLFQALAKLFGGLALVAALLFVPAGTLNYPNAWLFICVLFVPMLLFGFFLLFKDPELLKKRLNMNEKEKEQKSVISLSALMFILGFAAAGLDFRFKLTSVPAWGVILAVIVFLTGYLLFAVVMRQNSFLSRTVEVQQNQTVSDTGLYGIVRHPMYFATVLLFWAMPFVLGSLISFLVFLPYPLLLVKRIKNEEDVLLKGLDGYGAYMKKVKYRLIPFVW